LFLGKELSQGLGDVSREIFENGEKRGAHTKKDELLQRKRSLLYERQLHLLQKVAFL